MFETITEGTVDLWPMAKTF